MTKYTKRNLGFSLLRKGEQHGCFCASQEENTLFCSTGSSSNHAGVSIVADSSESEWATPFVKIFSDSSRGEVAAVKKVSNPASTKSGMSVVVSDVF